MAVSLSLTQILSFGLDIAWFQRVQEGWNVPTTELYLEHFATAIHKYVVMTLNPDASKDEFDSKLKPVVGHYCPRRPDHNAGN